MRITWRSGRSREDQTAVARISWGLHSSCRDIMSIVQRSLRSHCSPENQYVSGQVIAPVGKGIKLKEYR